MRYVIALLFALFFFFSILQLYLKLYIFYKLRYAFSGDFRDLLCNFSKVFKLNLSHFDIMNFTHQRYAKPFAYLLILLQYQCCVSYLFFHFWSEGSMLDNFVRNSIVLSMIRILCFYYFILFFFIIRWF